MRLTRPAWEFSETVRLLSLVSVALRLVVVGDADGLAGYAFVSYACEDSTAVGVVREALERAGIRVWRDATEVWPGQDWQAAARQAISGDAVAFLAFFSRASLALEKSRRNEELLLAISDLRRRQPGVPWLIPVRLDDCEIPDLEIGAGRTLRSLRPVDLFGPGKEQALARLVQGVSRHRDRGQPPVPGGSKMGGSAYMQQVRRIAPPDPPGLLGREAELAELAATCTEPEGRSYTWWQGRAWAGKSALLSTFVLNPPTDMAAPVSILSFFITARLAAQDTREAFIQVLLSQLACLTGQDVPAVLPQATREAHLLELLAGAAAQCQAGGGRLVLVVDGLDEDGSVMTGPHAHSIAGLLPARPPAGMRVIVSGRPDPPVPDDVPDLHPLRDVGIVRPLDPSPHAHGIARLARQELDRLLHGTAIEQDALGLLAAARGGLSAPDLADLAGVPLWEVEDILRHAQGRTFASRPSQYRPGIAPEVYLLGHEELQATARRYLAGRIPGYHDRLRSWAGGWRDAGWPPGTPDYLLSGFFQLMDDLGDLDAMVALAGDVARQDRMLDLTGGDAAAQDEIRTVLQRTAAQDEPDLADVLYLAFRRDQLAERSDSIPNSLPAVWAAVGDTTRALALIAAGPDPAWQASALEQAAGALAAAGQHERAAAAAGQIEAALARSIYNATGQVRVLAVLARALAAAGQHDRAEAVAGRAEATARSIAAPDRQPEALAVAAGALAAAGQRKRAAAVAGQAEAAARSIRTPYEKADALREAAGALAAAGQFEQAEAAARSISGDAWRRAMALARVARELAAAGWRERAAVIARQADADRAKVAARPVTDPAGEAEALTQVAAELATGQYEQAERTAQLINSPHVQSRAMAQVASALAEAGLHEQAAAAASRAEAAARSVTGPSSRTRALVLGGLASALAAAGQHELAAAVAGHAEAAARLITDPHWQAGALQQVTGALAAAGRHEQAASVARSITGTDWQAPAQALVAEALAAAGHHQEAEAAVLSITSEYGRALALARVAGALAAAGQHSRAAAVAGKAEVAAWSIPIPSWTAQALALVAGALATAGRLDQAALVAQSVSSAYAVWRARALAFVAGALAAAGKSEQAAAIAEQTEAAARSILDPKGQGEALALAAGALAAAGRKDQAAALADQALAAARSEPELGWQAWELAQIARVLAVAGLHNRAAAAARSIADPRRQAEALTQIAMALIAGGHTAGARRMTAAALTAGDWSIAAVPALILNPSSWERLDLSSWQLPLMPCSASPNRPRKFTPLYFGDGI